MEGEWLLPSANGLGWWFGFGGITLWKGSLLPNHQPKTTNKPLVHSKTYHWYYCFQRFYSTMGWDFYVPYDGWFEVIYDFNLLAQHALFGILLILTAPCITNGFGGGTHALHLSPISASGSGINVWHDPNYVMFWYSRQFLHQTFNRCIWAPFKKHPTKNHPPKHSPR